jgi:hypothetical protein
MQNRNAPCGGNVLLAVKNPLQLHSVETLRKKPSIRYADGAGENIAARALG